MAVRVDIEGRTVGYLSREHARQYRKQLERAGHASTDAYCDARIRGGWDRREGGQGHYGVFLDLRTAWSATWPRPNPACAEGVKKSITALVPRLRQALEGDAKMRTRSDPQARRWCGDQTFSRAGMEGAMIGVLTHHWAKTDKVDEARKLLDRNGEAQSKAPGFVNRQTLYSQTDPTKITTLVVWASNEIYDAWRASPARAAAMSGADTLWSKPPESERFDVAGT